MRTVRKTRTHDVGGMGVGLVEGKKRGANKNLHRLCAKGEGQIHGRHGMGV